MSKNQTKSNAYLFILKEGKEIKKNGLDYTLMLLHTEPAEIYGKRAKEKTPFFLKSNKTLLAQEPENCQESNIDVPLMLTGFINE